MKLFYAPGVCSIGIHMLMEEIGKPYEAIAVNFAERAQYKPDFTSVNPKSKVPTLIDDEGTVRTEYPAIAYWLARKNPYSNLLPDDIDLQAKVLEIMDYCVATLHMRGFTRMFRPAMFAPSAADEDAVKAAGREIVENGLAQLDKELQGKDYIVGKFSIADSAVFYLEFWAKRSGVPMPPNVATHFERMMARPSTRRMLKAEGLA